MTINDIIQEVMSGLRPPNNPERREFNKKLAELQGRMQEYVSDAVRKAKSSSKPTARDAASELQKWLDSPMSDDDRNRHALAAMDMMLANGADIKELTEIKKSWGIGQAEDQKIETVDFSTAFPDLAKALKDR